MRDREFLIWLHARLEHVHGEDRLPDYMHKLRSIIHGVPEDQDSINDGRGEDSLEALLEKLEEKEVMHFDELVALRLQKMTKCEALDLAIANMHWAAKKNVDCEAARRLLIVMRGRLQGGSNDDTETNMPWV